MRVVLVLVLAMILVGCVSSGAGSPGATDPLRASPAPIASAGPSGTATPDETSISSPSAAAIPSAAPSPSAASIQSAAPEWARVPDQKALADSRMVAVAAGPGRYVAVGPAFLADGQDIGMAWTSEDGVAWRRAPSPPDGGIPTGVISDRGGYVAWGWWQGNAIAWTSPDGRTWSRATVIPDSRDARIEGVARLGADLVAVGDAEIASGTSFVHELRTWTSPDGVGWTPVSAVTSIRWDGYVNGVTAADGALVAWGYARLGDEFPPVTLRSTDGRRWDVGWIKPGIMGHEREGINDVIGVGGRMVAVGHGLAGEAGSPPPPIAAWTSSDGLTWERAVFEGESPTGGLGPVVWYEDQYVALGGSGVWCSVDGTMWTRSTSGPDAGSDGEGADCSGGPCPNTIENDLTAGPAGLVAVGASRTAAGGSRSVVWFAPAP